MAAFVSRSLCSAPGWIEKPAPLRGVGFGARSGLTIVSKPGYAAHPRLSWALPCYVAYEQPAESCS